MIVCVAEDRPQFEVCVKLLLLSLANHCPDLAVELFFPVADAAFKAWLGRCPHVHLNQEPLAGAYGWNVKPQALLTLMDRGATEILWIDSDILITRDIRGLCQNLDDGTLVVTEEALSGFPQDPDGLRCRAWGLPVGRQLPFVANTGFIRATTRHRPLLVRWRELIESPAYREAQSLPFGVKPLHMFSDQDVLTALLTSRDFADIDVKFLTRGEHIIQYNGVLGYTCAERVRHLFGGLPPLVHSVLDKPWLDPETRQMSRGQHGSFLARYQDLSPYTILAKSYGERLESDCAWMEPNYRETAFMRALGFGQAPLTGLPMAIAIDAYKLGKSVMDWVRRGPRFAG